MQFESLKLGNWRQFDGIDIEFHPRLTILTGPNGAGKTTILNMLSRSIGWTVALMAVPDDQRRALSKELSEATLPLGFEVAPTGTLILGDGSSVPLDLPVQGDTVSYSYGPMRGANGVYITSHRQAFSYAKIPNIPTNVSAAGELLASYTQRLKSTYKEPKEQELIKAEQTPSFRIKQSLIALAVFGEGNSIVSPNYEALDTFRGFEQILKFVLPDEIGFQRLLVKIPELFVVGTSGMFPLEAVSGGAAAIVDLAWQVYLASKVYDDFVVLIDEPENHLHPSLQKRLLGNFVDAFPSAQFVVATHSPLVINSVESSSVYVLSAQSPGRYVSQLLDFFNKTASAEATLSDVLGVDASTPAWAARKFEEIVERYDDKLGDREALDQLRLELKNAGMSDRITDVIKQFLDRARD
jgi:hypothetical protein